MKISTVVDKGVQSEVYQMKKSIDEIIKNVNATMSLENMPLTDEDKQRLRDIHEGKTTSEKERKKIIDKYMER